MAVLLLGASSAAQAYPFYVATFQSLGVYWSPPAGSASNNAKVQFREAGTSAWRRGLDLWFDERNSEYRGSLVELKPGTNYEVKLTLDSGDTQSLEARTWSERFKVKRMVHLPRGTTRLVIDAADSGNEEEGYVVFTGRPGQNVIDQSAMTGDDLRDSCIIVRQGVHHVIIRGLVLKNCRRAGILLERQLDPVLETQTRDIVIEDNEISGWGGFGQLRPERNSADNDGAVHCNYWRETVDARRPDRIVIQRNAIRDPRHGTNPWLEGAGPPKHPAGPLGVLFVRCGTNHVIRYNDIYSTNGNFLMDGLGGGDNFSTAGFPWADSDIYGNRISQVYDDAIEAEGGNRNVRIWANYLDEVFVAMANATTAVGPLYVWRNVSYRMARMHRPQAPPDPEQRGPFVKAGSRVASVAGGRAYYFHNTVLQPVGRDARYALGAGGGIANSGGKLYNIVSRNNIWHIHKTAQIRGEPKFASISADADQGLVDVDYDLHNGLIRNAGPGAQRNGWKGLPVYASSEPGSFSLKKGSPGFGTAVPIPNFNDQYAHPDVGAHQSGTPPMKFGSGL